MADFIFSRWLRAAVAILLLLALALQPLNFCHETKRNIFKADRIHNAYQTLGIIKTIKW